MTLAAGCQGATDRDHAFRIRRRSWPAQIASPAIHKFCRPALFLSDILRERLRKHGTQKEGDAKSRTQKKDGNQITTHAPQKGGFPSYEANLRGRAAALLKQACPALKTSQVRDILRKSARDVTKGKCSVVPQLHTGLAATVGPDVATGDGLVDAHKAALLAKIRCLGPIQPVQPPVGPIQPIRPPIRPIQPIVPPIRPADTGGAMGAAAAGEGPQQARLSVDEVEALEEMILQDELDLES